MFNDDTNGDIIHQNYFSNCDKIKIKPLVTCILTAYRQKKPRFVKVTLNTFIQNNTEYRILIKFLQTLTVLISNQTVRDLTYLLFHIASF